MPVLSPPDLLSAVAALPPGHPSTWDTEQAREGIPALVALENQLASWKLAAIATFDAHDGARAEGHRTTADWLKKTTRASHAGYDVHTARDLRDVLPETAQALAAGQITAEQVRIIRGAFRVFANDLPETALVDYAKVHTAAELRTLVELMKQQYAADGYDEDTEKAREKREVHLSKSLGGWWRLTGMLDPVAGEKLKAALEVFSQTTSPDDQRDAAARRADAILEIAERALDPNSTGQGHLTITITPEQLESKLGVTLPSGLLVSRADAAIEACIAEVTYIVGHQTGVAWQPLAVGFAERFATPAQRRALAVRDGNGCAHPCCTVQAWRCVAHHIIPWDEGGPTEIQNLVLLCRYHHREVHRGKLKVVFQEGRATTTCGDRAPP